MMRVMPIIQREFFIISAIVLSSTFLMVSIPYVHAATVSDPPTGLSALPISPTSISLYWSAPQHNGSSAVTGYKIESKNPTTSYSTLITLGNVTKYNSTGLTTGKTYIFRVSAINKMGTSNPSNEAVATPTSNSKPPQNIVPNPPTSLSATSGSSTEIDLSWNPPAGNNGPPITGYKIQYSIDSANFTNLVANSGTTTTSYAHTGVSTSHTYNYRVFAINSIGTSNSSSIISISPTIVKSIPSPPTGLKASVASQTSISLSWNVPGSNGNSPITGYKIEAKIGSGAYTVLVENTGTTATSYLNTVLKEGTAYTYRVSAINAIGTSNPSNEISATPAKTLVPSGVTATAVSPTEIDLSWIAPSETYGQQISGYRIDEKLSSATFDPVVDNTGLTTNYAIKNLKTNQAYTFVIVALFTDGGSSNPSVEVSATPTPTSTPPVTTTTSTVSTPQLSVPDSPTSLNTIMQSTSSVKISWTAPVNTAKLPITGYKIEYKSGSDPYSVLKAYTGTDTTFIQTGLGPGTYTYRVSAINAVGTGNPSSESTITIATNTTPPPPVIESYGGFQTVTATDYSVGYNIMGGKVTSMTVDQKTFSLHTGIQSKTGGTLSLNLPRGLIDAKKLDATDDVYLISDGTHALNFTETRSSDVRTVVISYPVGTTEVAIYGTHVIPEFPFAVIILVIGFAATIFFSRKVIRL